MFSRLSSRALNASRASVAPRVAAAFPSRQFHKAPVVKNAAAKEEFPPGIVPEDSIIAKYGTIPFFGMGAAILITKEIFIIDAEWLLAMETAAFAMTGYVLIGDSLNKHCADEDAATKAKFDSANDFLTGMLDQYKLVQTTAQSKPAVLAAYMKEYEGAAQEFASYQTVVPKHKARAQVLASLEAIRTKEQHAAAEEWQSAVDKAVANVSATFDKGDAKLSEEMLNLAIDNIGYDKPNTTPDKDPVKRLFMEQFK